MNNNSNNCGDCGTTCSECGRPWAICKQDGGCGCNKCKDIKFCEYGRMANGCIREKQPGCPMQAVIPSVTVESIEGIKNLADCLVHVSDINTTFYIDDKHRPIITWAGPIDIPGYDMEGNPNNYRDQIVTDTANQIAVIYDRSGKGYIFGLVENIDLQEQVNNKLDAMAEDGTLQEIISEYLNSTAVFGFDTVADMKSATNLIDGSFACTLGYHAKNDGGGALYKIRTITNDDVVDEATIVAMNDSQNNLIAELVLDVEPNVNQFGAYGDGTHDDTTAIQKAFNCTKIKTLAFIGRCTYLINDAVTLTNKILLKGNKAVIKAGSANAKLVFSGSGLDSYQAGEYLWFDGDYKANIGIEVSGCRGLKASQIYVRNVCQKGIYVHKDPVTGFGSIRLEQFSIENVVETTEQFNAVANSIGLDIDNTDSEIYDGNIKEFKIAIKCQSSTLIDGVHAWNYHDDFVADSIMVDAYGGVRVTNSYCDGLPIFVKQNITSQYTNTVIDNCIFNFGISQNVDTTPYVIYKGADDKANITNCSIDCSYKLVNWPVANTFENVFENNNFCVRAYFVNYYKGSLTDENIGTLEYERIGDIVEYNFTGVGTASSDASFTEHLPVWAWPKHNTRMVLTTVAGTYPRFTITNIGEVMQITCSAWANGSASAVARYKIQSPTNE